MDESQLWPGATMKLSDGCANNLALLLGALSAAALIWGPDWTALIIIPGGIFLALYWLNYKLSPYAKALGSAGTTSSRSEPATAWTDEEVNTYIYNALEAEEHSIPGEGK